MSELVMLLREFGWPVLILIALVTIAFLAVFVWVAKKMFDTMHKF